MVLPLAVFRFDKLNYLKNRKLEGGITSETYLG